jgi:hypothetical protein
MIRQTVNTYTPGEVDTMIEMIDLSIEMMSPCKEDKETVTCLTCDKRQAIQMISQIKQMLEGTHTYTENNL